VTEHPLLNHTSVAVEDLEVAAYTVPTDEPESDGTLAWDSTTIVVVTAHAAGLSGTGYTYGDTSVRDLIQSALVDLVVGTDAIRLGGTWEEMRAALRNIGSHGTGAMAASTVDVALWDLKARLLELPLGLLLGPTRDRVPVYGSGGFTSYDHDRLHDQLSTWAEQGIGQVKIKVGRHPKEDEDRLRVARDAVGADVELFVDANGAYSPKQALGWAHRFAAHQVTWFEEPVSSDDIEGLRLLRERGPAGMDIAAGEYGATSDDFLRPLRAGAIDCLQIDATRCGGYTGFLRAAALADAVGMPVSAHTAPALHLPVCAAAPRLRHQEWFHTHVRVEELLFHGVPAVVDGALRPDDSRAGHGLHLRGDEIKEFSA
jgi:L-alanine-DL-glutamate epimerase-like enolase superfamily enzyme